MDYGEGLYTTFVLSCPSSCRPYTTADWRQTNTRASAYSSTRKPPRNRHLCQRRGVLAESAARDRNDSVGISFRSDIEDLVRQVVKCVV